MTVDKQHADAVARLQASQDREVEQLAQVLLPALTTGAEQAVEQLLSLVEDEPAILLKPDVDVAGIAAVWAALARATRAQHLARILSLLACMRSDVSGRFGSKEHYGSSSLRKLDFSVFDEASERQVSRLVSDLLFVFDASQPAPVLIMGEDLCLTKRIQRACLFGIDEMSWKEWFKYELGLVSPSRRPGCVLSAALASLPSASLHPSRILVISDDADVAAQLVRSFAVHQECTCILGKDSKPSLSPRFSISAMVPPSIVEADVLAGIEQIVFSAVHEAAPFAVLVWAVQLTSQSLPSSVASGLKRLVPWTRQVLVCLDATEADQRVAAVRVWLQTEVALTVCPVRIRGDHAVGLHALARVMGQECLQASREQAALSTRLAGVLRRDLEAAAIQTRPLIAASSLLAAATVLPGFPYPRGVVIAACLASSVASAEPFVRRTKPTDLLSRAAIAASTGCSAGALNLVATSLLLHGTKHQSAIVESVVSHSVFQSIADHAVTRSIVDSDAVHFVAGKPALVVGLRAAALATLVYVSSASLRAVMKRVVFRTLWPRFARKSLE